MVTPDVLVVEDDAAIRELVIETLSEEGLAVLGLASGSAAMTTPVLPRLLLLDRHLGDYDAGAVLAALRRERLRASVPVVLMSASATVRAEAEALGVDGALAKPFQLDELVACVYAFLNREPAACAVGE